MNKLVSTLIMLVVPLLRGQTGASVEGVVTNSMTHGPVSGASVVLSTKGEQYNATTDQAGAYRMDGLKPGQYGAVFYKTGFLESRAPSGFGGPGISIGLGGNTARVDGQITPLATISGRVVDPEGKPAPGVSVETQAFDSVETDSEGRFVLDRLRPGSYSLVAKPKPLVSAAAGGERMEAIPTFFPSAIERGASQPIAVRGGDELSGFEIRLRTSRVYRVRGGVLDEAGKPVPRPTVKLLSASQPMLLGGMMSGLNGARMFYFGGGNPPNEETYVLPDENGTFEFGAVRPGDWLIRGENEAVTRSATAAVTVTDKDLDNLEIRFAPRFTVHGTVDWGDRQPPVGARVASVLLHSEDGAPAGGRPTSDADGNLTFPELVPGRYRIIPLPGFPAGYYAASVLLGDREVRGQAVELTPESPPIHIYFRPNAGSVRGTVENGAGATVLLWPQVTGPPDLVPAVLCGPSGAFEIPNVPPGDYYVMAFDRVKRSQEADEFLRSAVANAVRVSVDETASASVQLSVIHWPE